MKKNELNAHDKKMNLLYHELDEAKELLIAKTRDAITKSGVVNLFPEEGSRKGWTAFSFRKAQNALVEAVDNYDIALNNLRKYYKDNHDKCTQGWGNPDSRSPSNEIVEWAYRNYYFKG